MDSERPLAIVDLDGVVADVRHRLHHLEGRRKDWGRFFAAAVTSCGVLPFTSSSVRFSFSRKSPAERARRPASAASFSAVLPPSVVSPQPANPAARHATVNAITFEAPPLNFTTATP